MHSAALRFLRGRGGAGEAQQHAGFHPFRIRGPGGGFRLRRRRTGGNSGYKNSLPAPNRGREAKAGDPRRKRRSAAKTDRRLLQLTKSIQMRNEK